MFLQNVQIQWFEINAFRWFAPPTPAPTSGLDIDLRTQSSGVLTGASNSFADVVGAAMSGVMTVAFVLVLFYLLWGGIEWITAGGDSSKIQKGRDRIVQSIIGLIVLASTVAMFIVLQQFIGFSVFSF